MELPLSTSVPTESPSLFRRTHSSPCIYVVTQEDNVEVTRVPLGAHEKSKKAQEVLAAIPGGGSLRDAQGYPIPLDGAIERGAVVRVERNDVSVVVGFVKRRSVLLNVPRGTTRYEAIREACSQLGLDAADWQCHLGVNEDAECMPGEMITTVKK